MQDVRQASQNNPGFPPILFFYQGDVPDGEAFFHKAWPEARAVADLPTHFYQAFGIEQGGMSQLLSPGVMMCGLRAASKGHFATGPGKADGRMMPGLFLVENGRILWQHHFKHAGDHPNFATLCQTWETKMETAVCACAA